MFHSFLYVYQRVMTWMITGGTSMTWETSQWLLFEVASQNTCFCQSPDSNASGAEQSIARAMKQDILRKHTSQPQLQGHRTGKKWLVVVWELKTKPFFATQRPKQVLVFIFKFLNITLGAGVWLLFEPVGCVDDHSWISKTKKRVVIFRKHTVEMIIWTKRCNNVVFTKINKSLYF